MHYIDSQSKEKICKFLKKKRLDVNISQKELSQKLGYESPQIISNYERGVCLPPISSFKPLLKTLGIEQGEFIQLYLNEFERSIQRYFKQKK